MLTLRELRSRRLGGSEARREFSLMGACDFCDAQDHVCRFREYAGGTRHVEGLVCYRCHLSWLPPGPGASGGRPG